jgi:nitrate reductase assembly molybdenum cofactor insertion protein NarJ
MARMNIDRSRINEAAEWRLIAALLERPRRGWHEQIAALAAEMRDPELRTAAAMATNATEGEYLRLVGPGGVVSPREVSHQPFADPGQLLAALATVYDAFAFRPRVEEPLDHVAVEAAFVGYLLLKEAYADARGARDSAATTAAARAAFIESHLAALAAAFAQRMAAACEESHLVAAARVLARRVPARAPVETSTPIELADFCGACR